MSVDSPPSSLPRGARAVMRLARLGAAGSALMLVMVTVIAVFATRSTVRVQVGAALDGLIDTAEHGVQAWYADQVRYAQRLARREQLRDLARSLLVGSAADPAAALDAIDDYLARQFIGILLIDRDFSIRATSKAGWDLDSLPSEVRDRLRSALAGEPVVTRPVALGSAGVRRLVLLIALPIRNRAGSGVDGVLLLAMDAHKTLRPLLRDAWNGAYECYLAAEGHILLGSRSDEDWRRLGVIDREAPPLAAQVRLGDPGRRLTPLAPLAPHAELAATPITRGLASATSGQDLDGFRDYRGVTVLASWRWLDDLGMALVGTFERDVAFRSARILERILLFALLLAAIALAASLVWFRHTERELRRAWHVQRRMDELDRYVIGDKIGEGAMGSVFRATHARLRRAAAIKVIRPHAMTGENIARFEREAQLTCRLTHPNTVQIFDYGTLADGSLYYVMEYLDGMSLQTLVRQHGAQPPGRVIHILSQALGALAEAHQLGLVHRDIKPSNLFLAVCGGVPDVVKLLDFGLARDHESDAVGLTRSGTVLGSPACMAPELIERGQTAITGNCDLYSLACVGYWLLTGSEVFEHATVMATLHAHCHEVPESPSKRGGRTVPHDIERVILRGLAKRPGERFADAATFRSALLACADAHTWTEALAQHWWQHLANDPAEQQGDVQAPIRTIPTTS